jgi:hypothetical protein
VNSIAATTTRTGLSVAAELDTDTYPTGVRVSDAQMAALPLTRHDWHGDWNYTLRPRPYPQIPVAAPDPLALPPLTVYAGRAASRGCAARCTHPRAQSRLRRDRVRGARNRAASGRERSTSPTGVGPRSHALGARTSGAAGGARTHRRPSALARGRRSLSLPLVAQRVDFGLCAASSRCEQLGPAVAAARTPGRQEYRNHRCPRARTRGRAARARPAAWVGRRRRR